MRLGSRGAATAILALAASSCATVYAVSFDPQGTTDEGRIIPNVPAEVTMLADDQLELTIPVSLGANARAAACVYAGDQRMPNIPVLTSQPSPRGGEVLRIRLPRESLEQLRGATMRITVTPPPLARSQEPPCPGADGPVQTYAFTVESAQQGRLLAAGIAGMAVLVVLTAGEW